MTDENKSKGEPTHENDGWISIQKRLWANVNKAIWVIVAAAVIAIATTAFRGYVTQQRMGDYIDVLDRRTTVLEADLKVTNAAIAVIQIQLGSKVDRITLDNCLDKVDKKVTETNRLLVELLNQKRR